MGFLLLESGDNLLLETSYSFLLEDGPVASPGDAGFVTLTVSNDATGVQRAVKGSSFDIGDKPVFTATFKAVSTLAVEDPATVVFMWLPRAGLENSYEYQVNNEVQRVSAGVYQFTPPVITTAEPHYVRAKGTAGLIAACESAVGVRISRFTTP